MRVVSDKMDNGNSVEYEGQDKVEEAIWSAIHDKQIYPSRAVTNM